MTSKKSIKKLKSKNQIDLVFKHGKTLKSGLVSMHYVQGKSEIISPLFGVGVPKKNVSLAYKRNRIKRQLRAIIQSHKNQILELFPPGLYMVLYKGSPEVDSKLILKDFKGLIDSFKA